MRPDQAFNLLQRADPASSGVSPTLTAQAQLDRAKGLDEVKLRPQPVTPRWRPILVGVAAFVGVLLVGVLSAILRQPSDDVAATTSTTSASAPTTTSDIDSALQQAIDRFVAGYNSGDLPTLLAQTTDDFVWTSQRLSDGAAGFVEWTAEDIRVRFAIDAALNTRIELFDCAPLDDRRVTCLERRIDDLLRAVDQEAADDVRVQVSVEDGRVSAWRTVRPDCGEYTDARGAFVNWIVENHPEVPNPTSFGCSADWHTDEGFELVVADLLAEFADR